MSLSLPLITSTTSTKKSTQRRPLRKSADVYTLMDDLQKPPKPPSGRSSEIPVTSEERNIQGHIQTTSNKREDTRDVFKIMADLKEENARLKKELEKYKKQVERLQNKGKSLTSSSASNGDKEKSSGDSENAHLSVVVVGASGDLAKKKTFPSLFNLFGLGLLPKDFTIVGFARSKMSDEEFRKNISKNFKEFKDKQEEFLSRCFYHSGQYDSEQSFSEVAKILKEKEGGNSANRMFYLAIPPSIFAEVATAAKSVAVSENGWNRIIVEKPFGKDTESSAQLSRDLATGFSEEQTYRIDHYLGKEMVQNLLVIRFANSLWEPVWNRHYIANITITFKEDIGTEGRGGYFDEYGIIRDVMQNHLTQMLALVAMETPNSLSAEDVRDEKVKVVSACRPISPEDIVVGQYDGYLDEDEKVAKDSITPTFATAVVHIDNPRWAGVPFVLKCGKGLNERKAEIRVQFKSNPGIYAEDSERNELVFRVQPNEAVYYKVNTKRPGLSEEIAMSELDLTYKERYEVRLPDAYERLIYDVVRGDHNLFVREDELDAAWKIFTPILHKLDAEKVKPISYKFGSRGPEESDKLIHRYGFQRSKSYQWGPKSKI
ncbi:hypothetical protein PROFUN_13050 [Planoprotostelium fungivorum]|uniref:Glucose-6-phosphate 1-dehydrogenase n=1 Tax=Planoprotostelium fungivorum TaxID=1890364 RepID=A0A2P6N5E0_9EUKA|nr:hypothetical protein PROFUN_13050 [Planoprotostelium fungivorum]